MLNLNKELKKGHTYRQWFFSILANFTLFGYGMECGWISPITKILQSKLTPTGEPLSDYIISWLAGSMSITAIFGVSLYTFINDAYGRKIGVICIAVAQALSWLIRLCYSSSTGLIVGRMLADLSAGGCYNVIPIYVNKISQDNIRGILGTLITLLQTIGLLVMYIIGTLIDYKTVIIIALALPIIVSVCFFKAPESPAFLVKQEKYDVATATVAYLRSLNKNDEIVQNIVKSMKNEYVNFKLLPNITYANISILISTGVKFEISPEIQTFSFPIFMICGSLGLAACVEICGRKPLLMAAFLISEISMTFIAAMMVLQNQGWNIPSWLPVLPIILAVTVYGGGIVPLPCIIMTEMFNFQVRGKVSCMVVTQTWMLTAILVTVYMPLTNYVGPYATFVFYAIINFLGSIFTFFYLPETRGKTEGEIALVLTKKRSSNNEQI